MRYSLFLAIVGHCLGILVAHKHNEMTWPTIQQLLVVEGAPATFNCTSAKGSPDFFGLFLGSYTVSVIRGDGCSVEFERENFIDHTCPHSRTVIWTIKNMTRELHDICWFCASLYEHYSDLRIRNTYSFSRLLVLIPPKRPEITAAFTEKNEDETITTIWALGDREVTLECVSRQGYPQQTVEWYNETAGIANGPLGNVTEETVTEANGTFTVWSRLTLSPTRADDRTTYMCRSSYEKYHKDVVSNRSVVLRFVDPPERPEIRNVVELNGSHIIWAKLDSPITLECVSRQGTPQQTVEWYTDTMGGEAVQESNETVTEANGTFTVLSRLKLTPTQADDRTTYICRSFYETVPGLASNQTVQVHLLIPPKALEITNASTTEDGALIINGHTDQELTIECVSHGGYPQPKVDLFKWYGDDVDRETLRTQSDEETVIETNGTFTVWRRYTFTPAEADNMTTFVCQVSSSIDVVDTSVKLHLLQELEEETEHFTEEDWDANTGNSAAVVKETDDAVIGGSIGAGIVVIGAVVALVMGARRLVRKAEEETQPPPTGYRSRYIQRQDPDIPSPSDHSVASPENEGARRESREAVAGTSAPDGSNDVDDSFFSVIDNGGYATPRVTAAVNADITTTSTLMRSTETEAESEDSTVAEEPLSLSGDSTRPALVTSCMYAQPRRTATTDTVPDIVVVNEQVEAVSLSNGVVHEVLRRSTTERLQYDNHVILPLQASRVSQNRPSI